MRLSAAAPSVVGLVLQRSVRRGVQVVEQPDRTRLAPILEQDRAAGPVGVGWRRAVDEQRLVHPGAGVHDPRPATGALPLPGIVGGGGRGVVLSANYLARQYGALPATVASLGKTVVGWNEYAGTTLPQNNAVVQYWNGDRTAVANAVTGRGAQVASPTS